MDVLEFYLFTFLLPFLGSVFIWNVVLTLQICDMFICYYKERKHFFIEYLNMNTEW